MFVLAQNKKLRGMFTKPQKVWKALIELEGDPCSLLVVKHDEGEIHTDKGDFSPCTYGRVCEQMNETGQVALHDADTLAPLYAVWLVSLDEIYHGADEYETDDGVVRMAVTEEGWEFPDE